VLLSCASDGETPSKGYSSSCGAPSQHLYNSDKPADSDLQTQFDTFYDTAFALLNKFNPDSKITVTSRDPDYVTAAIKATLYAVKAV